MMTKFARLARSHHTGHLRRRRNDHRLESLETRTLLSLAAAEVSVGSQVVSSKAPTPIPPPMIDLGESYRADGRDIGLTRFADRLAVHVRPDVDASAVFETLTSPTGPLWGFEVVETLGRRGAILATPGQPMSHPDLLRAATLANPNVARVEPVHLNVETQTYLVATDEVIVGLRPGVTAEQFFAGRPEFTSFRPLDGTPDQFIATVAEGTGSAALALADALEKLDPRITYATVNFWQEVVFLSVNDPLFPSQWHLNNTGQGGGTPGADIRAIDAWQLSTGQGIIIGVHDWGIEWDHPDLIANLAPSAETFGVNNGIDEDGNGWIDDYAGWDFQDDDNDTRGTPNNSANSHGTAVAGVAVASGNNNLGVAGAAYGATLRNARIDSSSTLDAVVSAIYYLTGRTRDGLGTWRGSDITNHSYATGNNTAITNAFSWGGTNGRGGLGTIMFVAAGNSGTGSLSYPASLAGTVPGVIAVGASTNFNTRSSYSQFGPELDFLSPSSGGSLGITTTDRVGTNGYNTNTSANGGDYHGGFGGTSSASPLAAAVGALVLARDPNLTWQQVRGLMRNTTEYIGPTSIEYNAATGFNLQYGYGRINAATAVRGVGIAEIQLLDGRNNVPNTTGVVTLPNTFVGDSATRTLRIRNQGTQTLTLSNLTISSGDFTIDSGFSATSLPAGGVASFVIRFTPTAAGNRTATVSFINNDTDEGNFSFTVQGVGQVPSLVGQVVEDWNGDGQIDSFDTPLANAQVYLDANSNGVFDVTTTNLSSGNVNIAIPDNNATGISSTITVSGVTGQFIDLDVTINITHPFVGDLVVTLTGPNNVTRTLVNRRGGSGDNFTGTIFDDQAATAITSGSAPFTGRFRPEESLDVFNGINPNGTWTLNVSDRAAADLGTLLNWSLHLQSGEVSTLTNANGYYRFDNLSAGNHSWRGEDRAGWRPTFPGGNYGYVVNHTAGQTHFNLDFGRTTDTTAPTASFAAVTPNPRSTPVASIDLTFSEAVTGVDLSDFALTRNGSPVSLVGATLTGSGATYTIGNLAGLTGIDGTYVLTLIASGSGIVDLAQNPLDGDASTSFVVDTTAPLPTLQIVTPNPRLEGVRSFEISFNEPVTGFGLGNLTLTRDGNPIDLTGVPLTTNDNQTFILGDGQAGGLLDVLTTPFGDYVLTLNRAGIADALGNQTTGTQSRSWRTNAPISVIHAPTVNTFQNLNSGMVLVAEFSDPQAPGTYEATIDWGDGSSPQAGVVEVDGTTVRVMGQVTPTTFGVFTTTVTLVETLTNRSQTAQGTLRVRPDVTSRVAQQRTAIVFNRQTGLYQQTIHLTNLGPSPLNGPLRFMLSNLAVGVTLANANGTINGNPFVQLNLSGPLGVGQTVSLILRFQIIGPRVPITYTTRLFAEV